VVAKVYTSERYGIYKWKLDHIQVEAQEYSTCIYLSLLLYML
jgi:hypothetical protein